MTVGGVSLHKWALYRNRTNLEVVGFINAHYPHVIIAFTSISHRIWACFTHTLIKKIARFKQVHSFHGLWEAKAMRESPLKSPSKPSKGWDHFPQGNLFGSDLGDQKCWCRGQLYPRGKPVWGSLSWDLSIQTNICDFILTCTRV